MPDNTVLNWSKDTSSTRSFSFKFSQKLSGILKRKGLWSPDGTAEMGSRKLSFRSNGKANMQLTVFDANSDTELGILTFNWKDFQRSKLKFTNGHVFQFQSRDFFRGVWSWVKEGSAHDQFVFRVDNPLHRSGNIESNLKDVTAEERDVLLLLGLQLQHYLNTWLLTIAFVIVGIFTGR